VVRIAISNIFIPVVLLSVLAVPAPASAATDYTWSGAGSGNWSNQENWLGGVAPSGTVGTLTFPYLGFPSLESDPYETKNDLVGISVNAMDIAGGFPNQGKPPPPNSDYVITGHQIPLGEGGITVTPPIQAEDRRTETEIRAPLLLNAPQTWTINGDVKGTGYLDVFGDVSGPSQELNVTLNNGDLRVGADLETAAINFTGTGSVNLGGFLAGRFPFGALNGDSGNPVTIGPGLSLFDENTTQFDKYPYDLGALTLAADTLLQVGEPEYNAAVTLPVNGGISFSPTSQLSMLFNSHIAATGPVNLNGASLRIGDGTILINGAPACNVLDVDTLIETTGTLTGTFQGIPDGALIPVHCGLPVDSLARVNYTPHSVIATLLQRTSTAVEVSNTTPSAGGSVTATATVTGERVGDGTAPGSVSFFDGGVPIAGCSAQPLSPQGLASSASCELSFPNTGNHEITASYSGSPNFLASASKTPRIIVVGPAGPGAHQGAGHGVAPLSRTIRIKANGATSIKLDCREEASCEGTLALTVQGNKRIRKIASKRFSIAMGKQTVEMRLNGAGRWLLARAGGRLHATLLIGGDGGGGKRRVALLLMGPRARR
jgi:Big-like domain-containing protein